MKTRHWLRLLRSLDLERIATGDYNFSSETAVLIKQLDEIMSEINWELSAQCFEKFVYDHGNRLALVQFWADWNPLDDSMRRVVRDVHAAVGDQIGIAGVEVGPAFNQELVRWIGITQLPTIVFIFRHRIIDVKVGYAKSRLLNHVQSLMQNFNQYTPELPEDQALPVPFAPGLNPASFGSPEGVPPGGTPNPAGFPGQGFPGQGFPGQGFPGQGFPGQGFPGQGFPGQGFPGQGFPGQGFPGQGFPGQAGWGQDNSGQGGFAGLPSQNFPSAQNTTGQGYASPPQTHLPNNGSFPPHNAAPPDYFNNGPVKRFGLSPFQPAFRPAARPKKSWLARIFGNDA